MVRKLVTREEGWEEHSRKRKWYKKSPLARKWLNKQVRKLGKQGQDEICILKILFFPGNVFICTNSWPKYARNVDLSQRNSG